MKCLYTNKYTDYYFHTVINTYTVTLIYQIENGFLISQNYDYFKDPKTFYKDTIEPLFEKQKMAKGNCILSPLLSFVASAGSPNDLKLIIGLFIYFYPHTNKMVETKNDYRVEYKIK